MNAREKSSRLERQFASKLESFLNRLARYREAPDAEAIHAVRTSFRRLEASYSIFPIAKRTDQAELFMGLAREFFSANSLIRDCDIMLAKLAQATLPGDRDPADLDGFRIALEASRSHRLDAAMETAQRLGQLQPPLIQADQRALRKGLRAQIRRRVGKIVGYLPAIAADEKDSEQIHEMRKQVKKLNYLLELRIDPGRFSPMADLKQIQILAGDIHDCDVTLAYLTESSAMTKNSAALLVAEQAVRHDTYLQLLKIIDQVNWKALQHRA